MHHNLATIIIIWRAGWSKNANFVATELLSVSVLRSTYSYQENSDESSFAGSRTGEIMGLSCCWRWSRINLRMTWEIVRSTSLDKDSSRCLVGASMRMVRRVVLSGIFLVLLHTKARSQLPRTVMFREVGKLRTVQPIQQDSNSTLLAFSTGVGWKLR